MAKHTFGEAVGKCEICTINLWDSCQGEPAIFPCGVQGCPYEQKEEQNQHLKIAHAGGMGSGLGQIDF